MSEGVATPSAAGLLRILAAVIDDKGALGAADFIMGRGHDLTTALRTAADAVEDREADQCPWRESALFYAALVAEIKEAVAKAGGEDPMNAFVHPESTP